MQTLTASWQICSHSLKESRKLRENKSEAEILWILTLWLLTQLKLFAPFLPASGLFYIPQQRVSSPCTISTKLLPPTVFIQSLLPHPDCLNQHQLHLQPSGELPAHGLRDIILPSQQANPAALRLPAIVEVLCMCNVDCVARTAYEITGIQVKLEQLVSRLPCIICGQLHNISYFLCNSLCHISNFAWLILV